NVEAAAAQKQTAREIPRRVAGGYSRRRPRVKKKQLEKGPFLSHLARFSGVLGLRERCGNPPPKQSGSPVVIPRNS
ncbi:hypothetical protein ACI4A9_28385, partial [Klebsiella pneumoniae]|uniref:hypothetical protein n=1 Tax=Klebsiella pneumoniae TaxID=573 RepID=UPI00385210EF